MRYFLSRIGLALLGVVLAPTLGGACARAGYLTSSMVFPGPASLQADGFPRLTFDAERPPEVVRGLPLAVGEGQDGLDESCLLLPWTSRSRTELHPGDDRSAPPDPVVRKGPSNPDVVFYLDPTARHNVVARLRARDETVDLSRMGGKRLFRPPRPAVC